MAYIIGDIEDLGEAVHLVVESETKDMELHAQRQARQIREQAQEKKTRLREDILSQGQERAAEIRRRLVAEAQQEAKSKRVKTREALIEAVWDQAEQRLRALVSGESYPEVLHRLAWLGAATLGGGRIRLRADPRGHDLLTEDRLVGWGRSASQDLGFPVAFEKGQEALDAWGGLIASSQDDRRRVDATFSARLKAARSEMRDEIFKVLVGDL
jgi:vacuolar-type H+-ATPase subunit E/Vma4